VTINSVRPAILTPATIAIISNHLSTRNQSDRAWLDDIVADKPWVRRFSIDHIDDVPRAIATCADAGIEVIAVDGGDGTVGLVFSALLNDGPYKTLPALALLPSGKTNMTAATWSLSGDRREALSALLRKHADDTLDGTIHTQPVLTLRESGNPDRHGAFFGGADIVDGILYCRKNIYPLGWPNTLSHPAAVAILFWRAMTSGGNGGSVHVSDDNADWSEDGRFYVVMATTMDKLLLGMRPDPKVGTGAVHYISLRTGALSILSTVLNLIKRRFTHSAIRTVRRSAALTFAFNGSYTLDGELYDTSEDKPLSIDGDQTLRFVRW